VAAHPVLDSAVCRHQPRHTCDCRCQALAAATGRQLPRQFWRYFTGWIILGAPAFFALLAVFYLMVAKPV